MTVPHHRHDLLAEFPKYGCGHHEHSGWPGHYHYHSGQRIDWRDAAGKDHSSGWHPHDCELPVDVPEGVLWRCPCGELWQLSVAAGRWVVVDAESEAVLRGLFGDLP